MQTDRRVFVAGLVFGVLIAPCSSWAQQPTKPRRIGWLGFTSLPEAKEVIDSFRHGLREHGWNEGADVVIEFRFAHGTPDRLPKLARELVRAKVEVMITPTETIAIAAKQAGVMIPIVIGSSADPVATGLIESLARPGGNITGFSMSATVLAGKRLELLREVSPTLSRVAVIWNEEDRGKTREFSETKMAARSLGVTVQALPIRGPDPALKLAFLSARTERTQAVIVLGETLTFRHRREISALAKENRVPTIWEGNIFMDAGGLMSYGPDILDKFRRVAGYVDKILKGRRPADLPVEQPTKFEFVVNLSTARILGLTLSPSLLLRVDRIIE